MKLKIDTKERQMESVLSQMNQLKANLGPESALYMQIDETSKLGMMDLLQLDNEMNLSS